MDSQQCDGWVRVETILDKKPKSDVLVVRNENFIDLDAEENCDFPFQGEGEELEKELEQVKALLVNRPCAQETSKPSPHRRRSRKNRAAKKEKKLACLSHSTDRVQEIERDNERIVQRLRSVAISPPKAPSAAREHDRHISNAQTSSIARRHKEEDQIIHQNIALYRRLQAVRPSNDVDRTVQEEEFKTNRKILERLVTKRAPPSPAPPGLLQTRSWDDRWHVPAQLC